DPPSSATPGQEGPGAPPSGAPKAGSGTYPAMGARRRSEEHTSELQSLTNIVCRLLLEKKKTAPRPRHPPTTNPRHDHAAPPLARLTRRSPAPPALPRPARRPRPPSLFSPHPRPTESSALSLHDALPISTHPLPLRLVRKGRGRLRAGLPKPGAAHIRRWALA